MSSKIFSAQVAVPAGRQGSASGGKTLLLFIAGIFLTLGLSISFQSLLADVWTPPTANPPSNNTDAPLNIGPLLQTKSGALWINTDGLSPYGLIVEQGKVGIGTTNPATKLEVNGAISGFGIVPIGSIMAWHKSFANTPALPSGWVECNGQILNDSDSSYNGQTIPDLNGDARFLRGGSTSGALQAQDVGPHTHPAKLAQREADSFGSGEFVAREGDGAPGWWWNQNIQTSTGSETRPINMAVVWIMRVK